MKKFKITNGNRVYIVDAKSHIDAISKVKAVETDEVRDSISQWKPGMSEIGLFQISYKKGTVYQSILVKAATKEDAINKFTKHTPDAEVIGVNEYPNPHFGEPILDSVIKDFTFGYGLFTNFDMWVNSLDDINTTNLVNYIKNAVRRDLNCDVAEIKTGDVPSGVPGFKFSFIGKYRNNKDSRWNDMSGSLYVHPSSSLEAKYLAQGQEKGLTKPDIQKQLKSEIANKLKQFANKTIYKDTSIKRDSSIKDAYIEEWYENTNENPYMVAKRYGVSVKPIKKRGADVLYRFEGSIDKLNRMHSDGYFMSIDMAGNSIKDSVIKDDRLSPMTYKKLKELGYDKNKWQNLTQEQANKIVQSNVTSSSNSGNKSTSFEKTRYDQPKTARTNNKQIIENNEQKTHKLSDISNEVVKDIKRFISKESTKDPRAIVRYIRNTAIIAAEKNKTNVCEGSGGEKYKFNVTDRSNYSQAFKMALGGVPVTVNGRIARVKFVTPDEYLAQSAKQKGISTSELLTNTDDEAYQNVLSGLKKDKTLSSGIYMDYNNKSQEGNRRVRALKELGVTSIPVLYVGRKWDKENDSALLHY